MTCLYVSDIIRPYLCIDYNTTNDGIHQPTGVKFYSAVQFKTNEPLTILRKHYGKHDSICLIKQHHNSSDEIWQFDDAYIMIAPSNYVDCNDDLILTYSKCLRLEKLPA